MDAGAGCDFGGLCQVPGHADVAKAQELVDR